MLEDETRSCLGSTSVARILLGRDFDNDVTFDHTFYVGVDPESFGGVRV